MAKKQYGEFCFGVVEIMPLAPIRKSLHEKIIPIFWLLVAFGIFEAALYFSLPMADASADPIVPGCGYTSYNWYSPCNPFNPPQPGVNNWTPIDGVPGMNGPHGYTPCGYYNHCGPGA